MPTRRWTDFPAGLRRVRVANGLTQVELAELLGVEQATVSRWERGNQKPDRQTQERIRDLLFHGRTAQDALLFHMVRTGPGGRMLFSRDGIVLAASPAAGGSLIEGSLTARFRNAATEDAWAIAESRGFFTGDIASLKFATELTTPDGITRLLQLNWYPARMTDGTTHVLVEADEIGRARYDALKSAGVQVTLLDEIL